MRKILERTESKVILPNRLKEIRKEKKITAKILAEKIHKTRANISTIENMKCNFSSKTLFETMFFLDVSFYDIFDTDNKMKERENIKLKNVLEYKGYENFQANNIKLICRLLGFSKDELHKQVGVTKNTFHNFEQGVQNLSVCKLMRLVELFQVPLELIINIKYYQRISS